jgi:sensor histidine kinase YesM
MKIYLLCILFTFLFCSGEKLDKKPVARKGILDLRNWNFNPSERLLNSDSGIIELDGEWEFYWNELIEDKIEQNKFFTNYNKDTIHYAHIPSEWQNYTIDNQKLPSMGYAMYRLKILLSKTEIPFSFAMADVCMSYSIYVNGELHQTNGKVGKSDSDSIPFQRHGIFPLKKNAEELEVVILISNFYHSRAGLWNKVSLGYRNQIETNFKNKIAWTFFTFGTLFIMSLYHFVIYFLRRKDISPFYFGGICFLMGLRTLAMEERVLMDILPIIPFKAIYKLEYLTAFSTVAFFFLFLNSLFPKETPKSILKFVIYISIAASFVPLFFIPYYFDTYLFAFLQILLLVTIFHTGYVLIRAIKHKREGSLIFLSGIIILYIALINDILYGSAIIYTMNLSIYGFLSFVLSQSIVLAIRFTNAFALEEKYNIAQKEVDASKQRLLEKEIQLKESETVKKKLELGMLKQTIQPHFLMNSLSTLLGLIRENPVAAGKLVNSLGTEIRTMLDVSSEKRIPLSIELEICRSYLEIMTIRLERKFTLKAEGIIGEEEIPPLILQTLVENAFSHSVRYTGDIEFILRKMEVNEANKNNSPSFRYEFLCIYDDSYFIKSNPSIELRKGTGTLYIKSRLEESYPGQWHFSQGWENKAWVARIGVGI